MVYEGVFQNGVVVLGAGVTLPEGAAVRVEVIPPRAENAKPAPAPGELDPVWRMGELAEDTGIPDLGVNIDHYLYGHPKVKDVP